VSHKYISSTFVYTVNPDSDKERLQSLRGWDKRSKELNDFWDSEEGKELWEKNSKEHLRQFQEYFDKDFAHEMSLGFDLMSYHDGLFELCSSCENITDNYRVLERRMSNGGCCGQPYHTVYLKEKSQEEFEPEELDNLIDRWHDGEGKGTHLWEWLGWSFDKYKKYVGGGEIKKVFDHDKDYCLDRIKYILCLLDGDEKEEFIKEIKVKILYE
jgi:hypothetical protein